MRPGSCSSTSRMPPRATSASRRRLRELAQGGSRTTPNDDGIPDCRRARPTIGHLHDLEGPWLVWNTDGDGVTWTVVDQLGTSGGMEERPTFNRFEHPDLAAAEAAQLPVPALRHRHRSADRLRHRDLLGGGALRRSRRASTSGFRSATRGGDGVGDPAAVRERGHDDKAGPPRPGLRRAAIPPDCSPARSDPGPRRVPHGVRACCSPVCPWLGPVLRPGSTMSNDQRKLSGAECPNLV